MKLKYIDHIVIVKVMDTLWPLDISVIGTPGPAVAPAGIGVAAALAVTAAGGTSPGKITGDGSIEAPAPVVCQEEASAAAVVAGGRAAGVPGAGVDDAALTPVRSSAIFLGRSFVSSRY